LGCGHGFTPSIHDILPPFERMTALKKGNCTAKHAKVATLPWRAVPGRKTKFTDSFSTKSESKIKYLKTLLNFLCVLSGLRGKK
jgi:hypothetical protein